MRHAHKTITLLQGLALSFALPFPMLLPASAQDASCKSPGTVVEAVLPTHTMIPYPTASQAGEQGITVVAVDIATDGTPVAITLKQSSGSMRLDKAAVDHIKAHWRWEPPMQDCKPAKVQVLVRVGWSLGFPPKTRFGLTMPNSAYPPGAIEAFESGDTYLTVTIDEAGSITDGKVAYSSGFHDLDSKALEVLKASSGAMKGKATGSQNLLVRWQLPSGILPPGFEDMRLQAEWLR